MLYELEVCEKVLDRSPMGDTKSPARFHVELRLLQKKGASALVLSGPSRITREEAKLDMEEIPLAPTSREIVSKGMDGVAGIERSVPREFPL